MIPTICNTLSIRMNSTAHSFAMLKSALNRFEVTALLQDVHVGHGVVLGVDGELHILGPVTTSDSDASLFFVLQMSDEVAMQFTSHPVFWRGVVPFQD